MNTRKKGVFSPPPSSSNTATSIEEKLAQFERGGRAEVTPPAPLSSASPSPPPAATAGPGRPPLTEETRRTILALRKDDVHQLEELCLRWKKESDSMTSVKTTMVLRSMLAVMLPHLEELEAVESEEDLRTKLLTLLG